MKRRRGYRTRKSFKKQKRKNKRFYRYKMSRGGLRL